VALLECLRSIQKTNPSLLLTASQLKRAERDARYVPAVASSIASVIVKSENTEFARSMAAIVRGWATATSINSSSGHDHGHGNEEEDDDETNSKAESDDWSLELEQQEGQSSNQVDIVNLQENVDTIPGNVEQRVQELSTNIEDRLRQVLAFHEESKTNPRSKRVKVSDEDDEEGAENPVPANDDEEPDGEKSEEHSRRSESSFDSWPDLNDAEEPKNSETHSGSDADDAKSDHNEEVDENRSLADKPHDVFDDDDWWP